MKGLNENTQHTLTIINDYCVVGEDQFCYGVTVRGITVAGGGRQRGTGVQNTAKHQHISTVLLVELWGKRPCAYLAMT